MNSSPKSWLAFLYIALCWIALCIIPYMPIGPILFLAMFFSSLAVGFALIALQADDRPLDIALPLEMLSGNVIPAAKDIPYQITEENQIRVCVSCGKIVFFLLSIFILVFWYRLSFHGLPNGWMEKGYQDLVMMYPFTRLGMDHEQVVQDFNFGEYVKMIQDYNKWLYHASLIYKPILVSLPYAGFIYWVLRGRRKIVTES